MAFVPIDFDVQDLSIELKAAGFTQTLPTFFLWEGVMHYLTAEAVDATLRAISALTIRGVASSLPTSIAGCGKMRKS